MNKSTLKYLIHPARLLIRLDQKGFIRLNDKTYLQWYFKQSNGCKLNLNNPKTFNEKLQWLKLNDHNPEYIRMVDKYEVKKYVSKIIGDKYIIPNFGVWNSFDEIDFDSLPNQFV